MAMGASLHGVRAANPALCPFRSQQQHRIPQERFSLSMQPRRFQIQLCVTRKSNEGSETIAPQVPEFERTYLALKKKYPIPGADLDSAHKSAQELAQNLAELRKANEGSEMSALDKRRYLSMKYMYLKHKDPWVNGKPSVPQAIATVLLAKLMKSELLNEDEMEYFERVAEKIEREPSGVLSVITRGDRMELIQYCRAMAIQRLIKYDYLVMKYKYLIQIPGKPNQLQALAIVLLGKLKKGRMHLNEVDLEYFERVAEEIDRENFKVLNEIAGDDMREAISESPRRTCTDSREE